MSVPVGVVHVGGVRVLVAQALVPMPMRMRLAWRIVCHRPALMVLVVHVAGGALHGLALMLVLTVLSHMQPDPRPIGRPAISSRNGLAPATTKEPPWRR